MATLIQCNLGTNKRRFLLFVLACGVFSPIIQQTFMRRKHAAEPFAPRSVTSSTTFTRNMTVAVDGRIKSNRNISMLTGVHGELVNKPLRHYDFVAFKKKPGWHFVKFPTNYHCDTSNVSVTVRYTDTAADIVGADAVFFSTGPFTLEEWNDLHRYRTPDQVWVFATQEPAAIIPDFLPPKIYRYTTYNWSFTFHSTSDIHGAYGWYVPNNAHPRRNASNPKDWHAKKPKLAAWVSSRHCEGLGWNRTKFVIDLGKHIHIDMYGKCGKIALRKNTKIAKGVFTKYKFHLSLENSCCSEYLSEKVWNALERWESVPIVLGGTREEYSRLMPPHSFIHADDFDSIEDLAKYITIVSQNATLYDEYFAWRSMGTVKQQDFHYRFPVFQEGSCKVADRMKMTQREKILEQDVFDPYGPDWFGSCYRCGDHDWIQGYNLWSRLTLFSKEWEDKRTLHWLGKN